MWEKKEKKSEEKKRYSMGDNFRYTFYHLRQKQGTGALFVCGGDVVMSVILPFLEAALAGAVAACLISGREPAVILLLILGYVTLLQAARFGQSHVRQLRTKAVFIFRCDLMVDYFRKILLMDGQSLESSQGQKKRDAGSRNIYSGNQRGIEAYAGNYLDLLINLCGLALYGIVVERNSLLLLALLAAQTALASFFQLLAGKRSYKMEDETNRNWKEAYYLRRESIIPGNGKDIRLYRMDQWFLKRLYGCVDRIVALTDRGQTGFMAAGMAEKLFSFGRNGLVYGYLILEMAKGALTLPAFLLYIGVVSGFEVWMSGLFLAFQELLVNEKLMDDYRDFMDFGRGEEEDEMATAGRSRARWTAAGGDAARQAMTGQAMAERGRAGQTTAERAAAGRAGEKALGKRRDRTGDGRYSQKERKPAPERAGSAHEIRLENVSFRYDGSDSDTLHNLNLTIRPGEKLALVGLNGAGKTTLIKLLCGLYRPTAGKVWLDGKDMQTLSRKEVFREFSVVFQEVFAFSFPLLANVSCCGEGREDESRLLESLNRAGLLEKAESLPRGIHTFMNKDLDPEGVSLSGGELQKLMLARALYKDAPIVILDEPTAALDPIAESEMYEKYDRMIRGKTGIFISHRLSSTRFCDRILFMEKGRIIEEGSHAGLMEKNGAYAELFNIQARYYQQKRREEESYA